MRHGGREVAVDGMNGGLGRMMDVACVSGRIWQIVPTIAP